MMDSDLKIQANKDTDNNNEQKKCEYPGCDIISKLRCSRCKSVYYCTAQHQKDHWSTHKKLQCRVSDGISNGSSASSFGNHTNNSINNSNNNSDDNRSTTNNNVSTSSSSSNNSNNGSSSEIGNNSHDNNKNSNSSDKKNDNTKSSSSGSSSDTRTSRCMFCGEQLTLSCEEDAIDHMRTCVALQEQLESKDQFTIPKAVREKNKIVI